MAIETVAIIVHDGVQALDVAGPMDVFAEANDYVGASERYEMVLVAADRAPVRASNAMRLVPDLGFDEASGGFGILLVAGGPALAGGNADHRMVAWLRDAPWRASVYGSICTGAFALGHAGLLNGRRCTTHWQHAGELAARFPDARVEPDAIHIRDGRMVTSAGVTAGIDLALSLVGRRHGPDVAVAVAKRLVVVAQRQGGQSQFSPYLTVAADPGSPIARVQAELLADLTRRHTLHGLASLIGMSGRNLSRQFVHEVGITPHEFVERARVDAARRALEGTRLALKVVAFECGFGTAERMRVVFMRRLGVTPAQYRSSFHRTDAHEDRSEMLQVVPPTGSPP